MEISPKLKAFGQMTPAQHLEWASMRLPPWVALLLVLILAWQLANLVWTFMPGAIGQESESSSTAAGSVEQPVRATVDSGRIKAANLFGAYQATDVPVTPSDIVDAPETRLRLILKGTVADKVQERAFAIIGEDGGGGGDKFYFVGDDLPGNAKLHRVYPEKVLLNRAGKLETLTLKTLLDKSATQARTSARQATPSKAKSSSLRELREKLAANPAQITDIIRPQPVFANGQQIGYRVYPGRDRQKFVELGLRPGDLVTEINGSALNDPAQGQKLFQQITQSDVINLTVQRSGQTQTLTLRMDE